MGCILCRRPFIHLNQYLRSYSISLLELDILYSSFILFIRCSFTLKPSYPFCIFLLTGFHRLETHTDNMQIIRILRTDAGNREINELSNLLQQHHRMMRKKVRQYSNMLLKCVIIPVEYFESWLVDPWCYAKGREPTVVPNLCYFSCGACRTCPTSFFYCFSILFQVPEFWFSRLWFRHLSYLLYDVHQTWILYNPKPLLWFCFSPLPKLEDCRLGSPTTFYNLGQNILEQPK